MVNLDAPMRLRRLMFVAAVALVVSSDARAQAPAASPAIDTGDTAWMLTSTALVLMMTIPGLALFYGGLVRAKNVLSTLMHSFFCAGLISVVWVAIGYTLSFGSGGNWLWGGLEHLGLRGVLGTASPLAPTIPHALFVAYQATFAVITPALISGAFAERMRFPAFAAFMLLWSVVIYCPMVHWVWGGGWIASQLGALDFAGGTVVHVASGISALVTAVYLGRRIGYGHEPMVPHNLPLTVIGASLLWVGWFGFNAGSALGSNGLAAVAFINTHTAAAAAALAWLAVESLKTGKPTLLGAASGAVAGLVAITPGAGFVTPMASIAIGAAGGAVCCLAVSLKPRLGYDDALDVVGVHMVGGTLGALLTGVFATATVNPAIKDLSLGLTGGLLYGHPRLLWQQTLGVLATCAFCGLGTLALLVVINAVFRIRATRDEEILGLDLSQHSERAYGFGAGEPVAVVTSAEPRPAMAPPVPGNRFTIAIDGVDPTTLVNRWRELCGAPDRRASDDFKQVYAQVTTIRGPRFRFRGGDREQMRQRLETLFKSVSPGARARLEA